MRDSSRTRRLPRVARRRTRNRLRAVDWYRTHDRLHCGDPIAMAADALDAYQADIAAGKDALLVCDTTEMADALNQRLHHQRVDRRRGRPRHVRPRPDASASGT